MDGIPRVLGPVFVGLILNWALFGGLIIQLYAYYNTQHGGDRMAIKVMVYSLFVIEIFATILVTMSAWFGLVQHWGDFGALLATPWPGIVIPCFNGFVSMVVQVFFAWRIWSLRQSKVTLVICTTIVATALMQCAAGFCVTILFYTRHLGALELSPLTSVIQVWLIGAFVCDLLIAVTMVSVLTSIRTESRFKRTETILNRLIINTIETGAITAVVAILDLILFLVWPSEALHVSPEYVLGRLYTNVLLAALNGRRRGTDMEVMGTFESNTVQFRTFRSQISERVDKDLSAESPVHFTTDTQTARSIDLPRDKLNPNDSFTSHD